MAVDLEKALERLYALRAFGIKPGLETVQGLLARLGNPQEGLRALHVAGTNGKGSVCALLEAALRAAGVRTGLYTSPHLVRFNERIRVEGAPISDAELAELFETMERPAQEVTRQEGREVTFFEFTTALAFEHFRRRQVQVAVVETGLGGRLDATNVLRPLLSVITRIGLEHTAHLGTTLEAIAGEKAGIIKPGRPVVCGPMPDEALAVIERTAAERQAPLVQAAAYASVRRVGPAGVEGQKIALATEGTDYGTVTVPLSGRFQLENCAMAVTALEVLGDTSPLRVPAEAVAAGFSRVSWPGRFQVLSKEPPVILDGAHNPDAGRALAASLKEIAKKRPVGLVCGMCADKDNREFLNAFQGLVKRYWMVPLRTDRSVDPNVLAEPVRRSGGTVEVAPVAGALVAARAWAVAEKGVVCIAGSLYLVGEVLEGEGWGQQQRGW